MSDPVDKRPNGPRGRSSGPSGSAALDPAGAILIRLGIRDGRVAAVELASSRPTDFSHRLFAGRPVDHLLSTLPMVFSVCATAQTAAAVQACERAAGVRADVGHADARQLLVHAETVREHLIRVLLGWSAWLGIAPAAGRLGALGRMRHALGRALYPADDAFRVGGGELAPDRAAVASLLADLDALVELALGVEPAAWTAMADQDALIRWAGAGDAIAQQMVRQVIDHGLAGLGAAVVSPLPAIADGDIAARLTASDSADHSPGEVEAFVAAPTWAGAPCETGALPRRSDVPLVAAVRDAYGSGVLTRQVARLSELIATLHQVRRLAADLSAQPAGTAVADVTGSGVAQVEAARGRLVHRVQIADDLVSDYRILAPTEWNFHPRGALAQGLMTLPADDTLRRNAQLLVDAVDPCVESRIEIDADA